MQADVAPPGCKFVLNEASQFPSSHHLHNSFCADPAPTSTRDANLHVGPEQPAGNAFSCSEALVSGSQKWLCLSSLPGIGSHNISIEGRISGMQCSFSTFGGASLRWLLTGTITSTHSMQFLDSDSWSTASPSDGNDHLAAETSSVTDATYVAKQLLQKLSTTVRVDDGACLRRAAKQQRVFLDLQEAAAQLPVSRAAHVLEPAFDPCSQLLSSFELSATDRFPENSGKSLVLQDYLQQQRPSLAGVWELVSQGMVGAPSGRQTDDTGVVTPQTAAAARRPVETVPMSSSADRVVDIVSPFNTFDSKDFRSGLTSMQTA